MAAGYAGAAKDRFTSLDTLAVVRELRGLPKPRVDKVFDRTKGGWSLSLRVRGEGRRELVIVPGRFAAIGSDVEHSEELSPLSRELRRLLTGTRLANAAEPGGERYLELELLAGVADPPYLLAVELFGGGNLLVARGGKILAVQRARTWAGRAVRIGAPYGRPPVRSNPWTSSQAEIQAALLASRTDRTTTLAARLSIGGPIAEELLARAGLAGTVSAPTDAERAAASIHAAIQRLLEEIGERPRGFLYRREDVWIDVNPFPSERFRTDRSIVEEVRPTFSEAALTYFESVDLNESPVESADDRVLAELGRQRDQQAKAIEGLGLEAERLARDGDALLVEYTTAERLIEEALRSDPKAKEPIDIHLRGRTVSVLPGRSIRDSAKGLFEESKRMRSKLEGARAALAETERRLLEGGLGSRKPARGAKASPGALSASRWFERYRWFVSSEGVLVIGGRDAASNDLIVRRYLHKADVYVHADVHGAPSVIVRRPPPGEPEPTDRTMLEAGQFGVSFSKAWRSGWASASAFWVTADQVSKAGASGEFVPRGAWVIHGTKNLLKDLPTELAIGTEAYEGEDRWVVAPPSAFAGRGTPRFLLTPGDERSRADREVELSRDLGLSRSRIQSLLPAGGITVRRA